MRFFLVTFIFVWLLAGCGQTDSNGNIKVPFARGEAGTADSAKLTSMEWKQKSISYGKIQEGESLNIEFRFTNTGKLPLVISKVEPGCGCTVADIPKEPIQPGKEGVIRGSFNSSGRLNTQHKTLLVYANAKGIQPAELSFEVEVEPKK